ncbi:MAG TPA: efflux RND transporter periplasmic adaptor subunit [Candidatus Methylomirabilis sp.]|nr:efflux RND transporter periplasmic adaptor subunit [Candidatus Methylomirabilis sp.]
MRRGKLGLISALIILVMGGAGGFYWLGSGGRQASYRTVPVEQGNILSTISSTGTLNAVITVQVGTQVSGTIQQLFVDYNSPVKKGMLIARIDPATFTAKVNQAKADVESAQATVLNQRAAVAKAQADLANAKANVVKDEVAVRDAKIKADSRVRLYQEGGISEEERDTAKATLDSAAAQLDAAQASVRSSQAALEVTQAQLAAAQAQVRQKQAALAQAQVDLDNSSIRAPVDGVVVARNVDVGQTVAASLQAPTLFLIAQDLTKMQVDTNVDEADIGRVAMEQVAAFTVDAYPGQRFEGKVVQVRQAPQVVQNVVTYDVVVAVGNPDLKLKPGMTANVRILVARHDGVLTIPNAAFRVRVDTPAATGTRAGGSSGQAGTPGAARTATGAGGRGLGLGAGAPADSGKQRVWVLQDGRPVERRIQTGLSDGEKTEVVDGLKPGELIIIGLASGQKDNGTQRPGGPPRVRL